MLRMDLLIIIIIWIINSHFKGHQERFFISLFHYIRVSELFYYENMPMQYIEFSEAVNDEHFQKNFLYIFFLIFAQNIYRGYTNVL